MIFLFFGILLILYSISYFWRKSKSLKGKHVFITGGSSGIGAAVGVLAAQEGAHVTIVARNEDKLRQACQKIEDSRQDKENQKVNWISMDLTTRNWKEIENRISMDPLMKQMGPVFVLVNCAGTSVAAKFEDLQTTDFYKLMDINYFGSVNITRALLPQMKAAKDGGSVVFVSSMAGLIGLYGFSAYSASKFALRGFAECLDMELKPHGIDVSVNFPPDTDTPGLEAENVGKPEITKIISATASLYSAKEVAKSVLYGAKKRHFYQSIGLDGWMLTQLCAGMTNSSLDRLIVQAFLNGVFRVIGWAYKFYFDFLVKKHHHHHKRD